jgi:hypothetical protein
MSRNLINASDRNRIEQRLNQVEGLDKEALRLLYRELRKSGRDKHQGGAGIGFIEIARRSDHLAHSFDNHDDNFYFTLHAKINKS